MFEFLFPSDGNAAAAGNAAASTNDYGGGAVGGGGGAGADISRDSPNTGQSRAFVGAKSAAGDAPAGAIVSSWVGSNSVDAGLGAGAGTKSAAGDAHSGASVSSWSGSKSADAGPVQSMANSGSDAGIAQSVANAGSGIQQSSASSACGSVRPKPEKETRDKLEKETGGSGECAIKKPKTADSISGACGGESSSRSNNINGCGYASMGRGRLRGRGRGGIQYNRQNACDEGDDGSSEKENKGVGEDSIILRELFGLKRRTKSVLAERSPNTNPEKCICIDSDDDDNDDDDTDNDN